MSYEAVDLAFAHVTSFFFSVERGCG